MAYVKQKLNFKSLNLFVTLTCSMETFDKSEVETCLNSTTQSQHLATEP